MCRGAAGPEAMAEEEGVEAFLAAPSAFAISRLTELGVKKEGINHLGMEEFDWYVHGILACAGITVELLKEEPTDGDSKYEAVQIVGKTDLDIALAVKNIDRIKFAGNDDQLGLQVKLNGAHKWKITIVDDNLPLHAVGGAQRARRASASASGAKTSSFENHNLYEVAVHVAAQMRCTVAIATGMTITIAFNSKDEDDVLVAQWDEDKKMPLIEQRRVDGIFTNAHVATTQVRVP